jgi:hypothetical protein
MIVYFIEVAVIGEANGGWPDIYRVCEHLDPALAMPAFLLLSFGVSTAVACISNLIAKKRKEKMFLLWKQDLDPIEVKIEAYGMGRMAADYDEESNIQVPYDILTYLANRYDIDPEDLMRAFVKGMVIERKNRGD